MATPIGDKPNNIISVRGGKQASERAAASARAWIKSERASEGGGGSDRGDRDEKTHRRRRLNYDMRVG